MCDCRQGAEVVLDDEESAGRLMCEALLLLLRAPNCDLAAAAVCALAALLEEEGWVDEWGSGYQLSDLRAAKGSFARALQRLEVVQAAKGMVPGSIGHVADFAVQELGANSARLAPTTIVPVMRW